MSNAPIFIFFHLSKSGGATLNAYLARHLAWDVELVNFSFWGRHYRRTHGIAEFADRTLEDRQTARVLTGHHTYAGMHTLVPDREARYFTVIRDPAERCVSLYNFRRSRGKTSLPFEDWYSSVYRLEYANSAVKFYAQRAFGEHVADDPAANLDIAIGLLEKCWIATVTPKLDEVLGKLSAHLSLPEDWESQRRAGDRSALDLPHHPSNGEVVRRYASVDDRIRERVATDGAADMRLFEWARNRDI